MKVSGDLLQGNCSTQDLARLINFNRFILLVCIIDRNSTFKVKITQVKTFSIDAT